MAAQDRPFASVVVPMPRPAVCMHPMYRCTPELDGEKRRIFRCNCGADRRLASDFDNWIWFQKRIGVLARAIKEDVGADVLDRLNEEGVQ